jgi:hypothetical protein
MINNFGNLAAGTLRVILLGAAAWGQRVPAALQVPTNEQLVVQVHAKGDQIYSRKVDGSQVGSALKAPEAQLFDEDGKAFGETFRGTIMGSGGREPGGGKSRGKCGFA